MPNWIQRDTLSTIALLMIGVGLWWISPPISLVAVGTIIYGTALIAKVISRGKPAE